MGQAVPENDRESAFLSLVVEASPKESKVDLWSDRVDQIKRKGNSSKNKFTEITFFISLYFVPASTLIFSFKYEQ